MRLNIKRLPLKSTLKIWKLPAKMAVRVKTTLVVKQKKLQIQQAEDVVEEVKAVEAATKNNEQDLIALRISLILVVIRVKRNMHQQIVRFWALKILQSKRTSKLN